MKLAKRTDSASRIDKDWRPHAGGCMRVENMGSWVRDCGLTLLLLFTFAVVALAPVATGFAEYNSEHTNHGQPTLTSPKSKPVHAPRVEMGR